MKTTPLDALCWGARACGLTAACARVRRGRLLVLLYHGVRSCEPACPLDDVLGYHVPRNSFARQMRYLVKTCQVVSAADACAGRGLSTRRKNVVITFDDGYRNVYTQAFPVLRELGLPALLALPTAFVTDGEPLWPDIVERLISDTRLESTDLDGIEGAPVPLASTADRLRAIRRLMAEGTALPQGDRDAWLNRLSRTLQVESSAEAIRDDPEREPLTAEDIRVMSESGLITYASHSHRHMMLTRVDAETMARELVMSKERVEQLAQAPCSFFCLPGGYFNAEVVRAILHRGYTHVFSSEPTECSPHDLPRVIGRFGIGRATGHSAFVDQVHGPVQALYRAYRHRRSADAQAST